MPLVDVEIEIDRAELPADVAAFLEEADRRVTEYLVERPIQVAGFVPSNYETVYRALKAIADTHLAPGRAFCEWGSGFGVVASLASMLGFDVCGIEIDEELVHLSRQLAEDFALTLDFVHGSFVPAGADACAVEAYVEYSSETCWMVTDSDQAYAELELGPGDFDVIFTYPWPGEEEVVAQLFERYAADGALLLEHSQFNTHRLRRKIGRRVCS